MLDRYAYIHRPAPGDCQSPGPGLRGRSFLVSLGVHSLMILLLLGTASVALKPGGPRRDLVLSELAPAARPARVRAAAALTKSALPAGAPVRSALLLPRVTEPRAARPLAIPEALPLPPAALSEPVKIALPEEAAAVAPPVARQVRDIQLGSFSNPAVERVALARIPAATGAFAGVANTTAKTAPGAVATAGFGEAAALRSERQGSATTAGAGFGDAVAGRAGRTGGAGTVGPGGFDNAVAGPAPAESRPVRAGDFRSAVVIETPKTGGHPAAEEGTESAIAILDKPQPRYTEEARQLKIEGEVWLQVSFAASGHAHVLGVLRGLGHGLDESASRSAEAIRFRPAMRQGRPVDAIAVARITFQLAY